MSTGETIISGDTIWTTSQTLSGDLVVEEGVTLTLSESGNIYVGSNTITISGGGTIIRDSSHTSAYMLSSSFGYVTLENITFDGNNVSSSNSMITVGKSLTINDGTVIQNGNKSDSKGGAINASSGILTINGGVIQNNQATSYGGAIYAGNSESSTATLIINGGTIQGNSTTDTTGDYARYGGGAIYARYCTFTMNDGLISNNSSTYGGAIYNTSYASTTINGGTIDSLNTASKYGNGIYHSAINTDEAEFHISGDAQINSDIYLYKGKYIQVDGALGYSVTLVPATYAEGTKVAEGYNYDLTIADERKILVSPDGDTPWYAVLSGDDIVLTTTAPDYLLSTVYVDTTVAYGTGDGTEGDPVSSIQEAKDLLASDGTIVIVGTITVTRDEVWELPSDIYGDAIIKVDSSTTNQAIVVEEGASLFLGDITIKDTGSGTAIAVYVGADYTQSDSATVTGTVKFDANLICVATVTNNNTTTDYSTIESAVTYANANGGTITLLMDVETTATLNITGTVTLDLNGYDIKYDGSGYASVITVSSTGNLTLQDSDGANKGARYVTGTGSSASITTTSSDDATAITGGAIYGGTGTNTESNGDTTYGAGVYVNTSGSFTMTGGNIVGNSTTSGSGGGVYCEGDFAMSSGNISNNAATGKIGGGVYLGGTTATMSGNATISGNTAGTAGGVYVKAGTFTMSGNATISGNIVTGSGGGMYVASGTFTMEGGYITGNTADIDGGAMRLNYGTTHIKGGTITGNTATTGDGIYTWVNFQLSGNPTIQDVYLNKGYLITLAGAVTGSAIPVTTSETPADDTPVTITSGASGNADKNDFTSAGSYNIGTTSTGEIQFYKTASYTWSYAIAEDDTTTIVATGTNKYDVNDDDYDGGSVTLSATGGTYTGSAYTATATESGWLGGTYTVAYYQADSNGEYTGSAMTTFPINVGTYKATITLGDATASVTYKIDYASATGAVSTYVTVANWYAGSGTETLTANTDYTISTDATTFSGTVTIPSADSSSENLSITIYVKETSSNDIVKLIVPYKVDIVTPTLSITEPTASGTSLAYGLGNSNTTQVSGTTYSTSDATGITVDSSTGEVKITNPGTYTVTATSGAGKTDTETVYVYDVDFTEAGGSTVTDVIVKSGGTVTEPTAPTKTGYTFDEWQTSTGTEFNFGSDTITANTTITATWTLDAPSVSVGSSGDTTYGTAVTLTATPSHDASSINYTYQWYKGSTAIDGATDKTLTLTNVADSGSYTVKVTASDGTLASAETTSDATTVTISAATLTVIPDSNQSKSFGATDPTLTYTYSGNVEGETPGFTGILSRATGESIGDYDLTLGTLALANNGGFLVNNYTLTLSETPVTFAISYATADTGSYTLPTENSDGWYNTNTISAGSGYEISTSDGSDTFGTSITLTDSASGSATFYVKDDNTGAVAQVTISYKLDTVAPTTALTAGTYNSITNTFTVTDGLSGIASVTAGGTTLTADENGTYTLPVGESMTVVITDTAGNATTVTGVTVKADVTVTFDANTGTVGTLASSTVPYDTKVTAPTTEQQPTKTGYTFAGWKTGASDSTAFDFNTAITANTTVYASWTLDAPTSVTINGDTSGTYNHGSTVITLTAVPTHADTNVTTYSYQWYKGDDAIYGATTNTLTLFTVADSGDYTVKVTASDGTLTSTTTKDASTTVTISPYAVTVPTAATDLVYNTAEQTALSDGTYYTVSDNKGINADSYTATATLKDTANYIWDLATDSTEDQSISWSIAKAPVTFSCTVLTDKIYNGNAQTLAVTATAHSASFTGFDVTYDDNSTDATSPTNAGTYTVTATINSASESNYYVLDGTDTTYAKTITNSYTIGQVTLTPSVNSVTGRAYNGLTATTGTISLTGAVNSESPTATATFNFDTATAGTAKDVDVTAITLGEGWTTNYTLSTTSLDNATSSADVTKVTLTPSVGTLTAKEYNGNTTFSSTITLSGEVNSEEPTATATAYNSNSADVDDVSKVTATGIALDGDWGTNYVLSTDTAEKEQEKLITAKEVGLSWSDNDETNTTDFSFVYDGSAVSVTATATGLETVGEVTDTCTVTVTGGAEITKGTYDATATVLSNSNYKLPSAVTKAYTITAQPITFEVSDNSYTYDSTAKSVTVAQTSTETVRIASDKFTVTYKLSGDALSAGTANKTDANTYDVVVEIIDGNFMFEDESMQKVVGTMTISPATLVGAWTDTSYTYDGTTKAPSMTSFTGVVSEESNPGASFTYSDGTTSGMGSVTAAGTYTVTATLDDSNYTLSNFTATFTIAKAPVTFAIASDGSVSGTLSDGTTAFTNFSVTYNGSSAIPTTTGSYTVYVTITGADASNYRLSGLATSEGTIGTYTVGAKSYTATFGETVITSLAGAFVTIPDGTDVGERQFVGWSYNNVTYKAGDLFTQPSSNVTFTAVYQDVYNISGIVVRDNGDDTVANPALNNAVVTLMSGSNQIAQTTTATVNGAAGVYSFTRVPAGTYNIVVTYDGVTRTSIVTISDGDVTIDTITMPEGITNSVVEVASGTPDVVVGELDNLFDDVVEENGTANDYTDDDATVVTTGGSVELALTVEEVTATVSSDTQTAIEAEASNVGVYLDISIEKTVTTVTEGVVTDTKTSSVTETSKLLTFIIPIPADYQNKASYTIYREHEGDIHKITTLENEYGEFLEVNSDKTQLTMYVKYFSTYALAYTEYSSGNTNTGTIIYPDDDTSTTTTETTTTDDDFPFIDVETEDYYYDAVAWAEENGITSGKSSTIFAPSDVNTRAEAVTFLWRAMGSPESSGDTQFTDLDEDSYYYEAVLWAVENGITLGTSDTTFSPYDTCSRAHIVTFLWRMVGELDADTDNIFDDVTDDDYYFDAVLWAVLEEITNGTSDDAFSPDDDCTRAQIVTFLYRYFG